MERTIGVIGAPSSAGAHGPGQEKAPRHLREAGLVVRLRAAGHAVVDRGDLPRARYRPDPANRRAQNLAAVVAVARRVADAVEAALGADLIPLVLGGDCSITLGVVAGFLRHGEDPALLYLDGGMDLGTPATYRPGIFDSLGVAHLVAEAGCADELARLGPRYPLMPGEAIVPFGYTPGEPVEVERALMERHGIAGFEADRVRGRAADAAGEALATMERRAGRFLVHFDVDAIDFVDFPAADVPHINAGIGYEDAMASLRAFAASPAFAGLVVTEFNPDHDEDGRLAVRFVRDIAAALSSGDG